MWEYVRVNLVEIQVPVDCEINNVFWELPKCTPWSDTVSMITKRVRVYLHIQ